MDRGGLEETLRARGEDRGALREAADREAADVASTTSDSPIAQLIIKLSCRISFRTSIIL